MDIRIVKIHNDNGCQGLSLFFKTHIYVYGLIAQYNYVEFVAWNNLIII